MSNEFFTRATWRSSKTRTMQERTKPWGGCKVAPAAFLEAAKRTRIQPGRTNRKICSAIKRDGSRCGMLALSGLKVCGAHGGFAIWARQGKLRKTGRSEPFKAARAAMVEDRAEAAPIELTQMPIYQQADQRNRMRLIRGWGSESWQQLVKQVQKQRAINVCV
jgi:hypothetical protein